MPLTNRVVHSYHWQNRMAQRGVGFSPTQQHALSNLPRRVDSQPVSKGLMLMVQVEEMSFLQTYGTENEYLDLKIDVFFNGDLCASSYITERARRHNSVKEDLVHYYSGLRVHNRKERPWILIPTEHNPGDIPERSAREARKAEERLAWINRALSQYASDHRHANGKLSKLGVYLKNLSKQCFPEEARPYLKSSLTKFGVIDVIVTAGNGKKDPSWANKLDKPRGIRTDIDEVLPEWTAERANWIAQDVKETLKNRPVTLSEVKAKRASTLKMLKPGSHSRFGGLRSPLPPLPSLQSRRAPGVSRIKDIDAAPRPLAKSKETRDMIEKIKATETHQKRNNDIIQGRDTGLEDSSQYPLTMYGQWMKEPKPAPDGGGKSVGNKKPSSRKEEPTARKESGTSLHDD